MSESTAITCAIHDPEHRDGVREDRIRWNGTAGTVHSVAVPERLIAGESFTVPVLSLDASEAPVLVRTEHSGPLKVTWLDGTEESDGTIMWPEPDRVTEWNASFRSEDNELPLPTQAELRLVLYQLSTREKFKTGVLALSALLCLAGGAVAVLNPTPPGFIALAVFLIAALVVYPPVLNKLASKFRLRVPADQVQIGDILLPPIRIEPRVEWSGTAADPLVQTYCSQVIHEASTVDILGLSAPINLDSGYVPTPIQVYRGAVPHTEIPQETFSQIDALLETDLRLKRMLGGEETTPEEAWSANRHLAIIGQVGSGKTTILQRLSLLLAKGPTLWTTAVPVFVELHRFARRNGLAEQPLSALKDTISEKISDVLSRAEDAAPAAETREAIDGIVDDLIQSGELALFLDGLDEVSAEDNEDDLVEAVLKAIKEASVSWPDVRIVVTCRRDSRDRYRRLPSSFAVAETVPFEQKGIERFVQGYFFESPDRAVKLLDELERTPRVRALASTPLLLALITLIFEQRGSLPQRRTEIYRRCVALLLREWDSTRARERHPRFLMEHKEDFLRKTAWLLHSRGSRYIRHDEIIGQLRAFLPSIGLPEDAAEALLQEITTHHGLIRTYNDNWYGFVHFALQEYFTAECIGHWAPLNAAIDQRHRTWWQEIIRLHAGSGDCTDLVSTLLREEEDLFHTNLRLAGECIAEGTAIAPGLREHVIDTLHQTARSADIPTLNERFWQVLTTICDADRCDIIWNAVTDSMLPLDVRIAVIHRMFDNPPASLVEKSSQLVLDDEIPALVRSALLELLGSSGVPEAVAAISDVCRNADADNTLRRTAVRIIALSGQKEAVPGFEEMLIAQETPTTVRRAVATALRTLNARGNTERILAILSDWHVETAARSSLAAVVGDLGEVGALSQAVDALSDPRLPSSVRTGLALSYKTFENPEAASTFIKLLQKKDLDYGVRLAVADTLGHIVSDTHHSLLQKLYSSGGLESPIRMRMTIALGSLGDESVMNELVRLLGDRTARPYLRLEAAGALGICGAKDAPDAMLSLINSRTVDALGQELAVLVLELRGEPDVAPALTERLTDLRLSLSARMRMAAALAVLGNTDVINHLISALNDRSYAPELRSQIAMTLRKLTDSRDERAFERVLTIQPGSPDVPEITTLLWHLSEQVGVPVLPGDVDQEPITYDWVETPDIDRESA